MVINCPDFSLNRTVWAITWVLKWLFSLLCHPIWCVIILVIKQIRLRQVVVWFCQSPVLLQTELDSTQSCYHYKKLIDNVPGTITLLRNSKNNYAEICLVNFLVEYYGFPETIFFSESLIFGHSAQWGIALYETANNSRDISCLVKNTKKIGEDNVILQRHLF